MQRQQPANHSGRRGAERDAIAVRQSSLDCRTAIGLRLALNHQTATININLRPWKRGFFFASRRQKSASMGFKTEPVGSAFLMRVLVFVLGKYECFHIVCP